MKAGQHTTAAKRAAKATYMRSWYAALSPERREALRAKRTGKSVPASGLSPEQLRGRRKTKREYMRRKLAAMTADEKAVYLTRRAAIEVPRMRIRRAESPVFMEQLRASSRTYYSRHRDERIAEQKVYRDNCRDKVLAHYGRSCVCCGEDEPVFLALDHTLGDGAAHRKANNGRSGYSLYRWLINNNFPEGFQTLCHNCNFAKRNKSVCPHRAIVRERMGLIR